MADLNTGDVIRVAGVMEYGGTHEITNVWHMVVGGTTPLSFEDATDDIKEYMDLLFDDIDTRLSNNQLADHLEVQNVTTDDVFGAIDWGVFAQGGSATDSTALGVCVFAWGRTRRPRVQIRKYFGVFTEDDMVDGVWNAPVLGAVNGAMAVHIDLQTMTDGLTLQGCAFNRSLKTFTLATSHTSSNEPAYQRRRKRGVGS